MQRISMSHFSSDLSDFDTSFNSVAVLKTHRLRWTVENFSKIDEDTYKSPVFDIIPNCPCYIVILKSLDIIDFFIYNSSYESEEVKVCCKSELKDALEEVIFNFEKEVQLTVEEFDEGESHLTDSLQHSSICNQLIDDVLIIDCTFEVKQGIITKTNNPDASLPTSHWRAKFVSDMKSMMDDSVASDVTFHVGEEEIRAHWAVICSRCPYFKRMYESGMRETKDNSITVNDIPLLIFKSLLCFMYTGEAILYKEGNNTLTKVKIDRKKENFNILTIQEIYEVYLQADKYELLDLKEICAAALLARMKVCNVTEILIWGEMHNDSHLRDYAKKFIGMKFDEVAETDAWEEMVHSNPKIASDVLYLMHKKPRLE